MGEDDPMMVGEHLPPHWANDESGRRPWLDRIGSKNAWRLGLVLSVVVALSLAAGAVGQYFLSPAQQAARAQPPSASVITSTVQYALINATVVLRAEIVSVGDMTVRIPDSLGSDLPVVTSVNTTQGAELRAGQLLLTVAERPIFVFQGAIPQFRGMTPGTQGVDVEELQSDLANLGYSAGSDAYGYFGQGTSNAVMEFYQHAGITPIWTSANAESTLSQLSEALTTAQTHLSSVTQQFEIDKAAHKSKSVLAEDETQMASAQSAVNQASMVLTTAQGTMGVTVPLGEVVFLPHLPARADSLQLRAGENVPSSGALIQIGSGAVAVSSQAADVSQLRPGMRADAVSDVSGSSFRLRISSIANSPTASSASSGSPTYKVNFRPVGPLPAGMVGQNVAVTIKTASSGVPVFIVPVSAVSTDGSGRTYVVVVAKTGLQHTVTVRLGLSVGGEQAVTPMGSALHAGDQVVIGMTSARQGGLQRCIFVTDRSRRPTWLSKAYPR